MYTSKILIENYLQRSLTENEEAWLLIANPAVKIWLDRKLGTSFSDGDAETRYYDGGTSIIDIEPVRNVSSVYSVDDYNATSYTYTNNTEYVLSPANSTIKTEIIARGFKFPKGINRIAVTGQFNEAEDGGVPQDIQMVATRVCAGLLNQGKVDSAGGNVSSESLEGHSISYDTSVSTIENLAENDPIIRSILDSRKELLLG